MNNYEIDCETYGTILVDYWVNCFERSLKILFSDCDKEDIPKIEEQLENAYDIWQDDDRGYCCEEYMLMNLHAYYKNHIVAVIYGREDEINEDN